MKDVLYPMKFVQFVGNLDDMEYNLRPYKELEIAADSKESPSVPGQSNTMNGLQSDLNQRNIKDETKHESQVLSNTTTDEQLSPEIENKDLFANRCHDQIPAQPRHQTWLDRRFYISYST